MLASRTRPVVLWSLESLSRRRMLHEMEHGLLLSFGRWSKPSCRYASPGVHHPWSHHGLLQHTQYKYPGPHIPLQSFADLPCRSTTVSGILYDPITHPIVGRMGLPTDTLVLGSQGHIQDALHDNSRAHVRFIRDTCALGNLLGLYMQNVPYAMADNICFPLRKSWWNSNFSYIAQLIS